MQDEKLTQVNEQGNTVDGLLQAMNDLKLNTVSKEEYDRITADNQRLIKEVTNNRAVVTPVSAEPTREDIIKRCEARTTRLGQGTSLDSIRDLAANYRDMVKLGMDVSAVDETVVTQLEGLVEKSGGDPNYFKALMEANIKAK